MQNDSLTKILQDAVDAISKQKQTKTGARPEWARTQPKSLIQLLRQLSGNAGMMTMPGAPVGGVQISPYQLGQPQRPLASMLQPGQPMGNYGQGGEATFFSQGVHGGMVPLSSVTPLGVPQGWKPFGSTAGQNLAKIFR